MNSMIINWIPSPLDTQQIRSDSHAWSDFTRARLPRRMINIDAQLPVPPLKNDNMSMLVIFSKLTQDIQVCGLPAGLHWDH